jgi:chromosome segregation ATPase
MRQPTIPDEEILTAARHLHADGQLTVRRLKEAVGVAERGRLIRACQEVRKSARTELPSAPADPNQDALEVPDSLRTCLSRLEVTILAELRAARTTELERARLTEAAHAARHEEQISGAEARASMLAEDLDGAEEEVGRLEAEIDRLTAELESQLAIAERERSAREAVENVRNAEAETHLRERTALNEALMAATAQAAANADGRSRAEAAAAAAQATAAAAESELVRLRNEHAELRTRSEALIGQLGATEADLKQAREAREPGKRRRRDGVHGSTSGRSALGAPDRTEEQ